MSYFSYSKTELTYLKDRDERLATLIDRYGKIERKIIKDPFSALVETIISQQISGKAAETIIKRLSSVTEFHPSKILSLTDEQHRTCGISPQKTSYLRSAADYFIKHHKELEHADTLDDESLINLLLPIRGVGRWSAEMILIFSYERKNILSSADLGIKHGLERLYGIASITSDEIKAFHKRFSPYATIASFYLWELASE